MFGSLSETEVKHYANLCMLAPVSRDCLKHLLSVLYITVQGNTVQLECKRSIKHRTRDSAGPL
jgi:hypothetical protein